MTSSGSFHEQPWARRELTLGDPAEAVFQKVVGEGNSYKYGLDRPPINLRHLPEFVRYTPDMLQAQRAVEVMGVGEDGILKLKVQKLLALLQWNVIVPVYLFVWDSHRSQYTMVPIGDVWRRCHEAGNLDTFPEGNRYWAIHVDAFCSTWVTRA